MKAATISNMLDPQTLWTDLSCIICLQKLTNEATFHVTILMA